MDDAAPRQGGREPEDRVLCLVPAGFAPRLADLIEAHYAEDSAVEVVVDRRAGDRRYHERRVHEGTPPGEIERRRPGSDRRRRERRRALELVNWVELPRWARSYEGVINFVRPRRGGA